MFQHYTCSEFDDLKLLKSQIDNGVENLTIDKQKKLIKITINNIEYEINYFMELESKKDCSLHLKHSFFYKYLTSETEK
jgi:hypothetical protein